MKSKSIITLLICLSNFQLVKAQFGYDFQWIDRSPNPNTVSFQPDNIASDFGRREFGSKFHDGVDFSGDGGDDDLGFKIKSINSGSVKHIVAGLTANGQSLRTYHIITIEGNENFGYGHIFRPNTSIVYNFRLENWGEASTYVIVCGDEGYALTSVPLDPDDSFTSSNGTTYSAANNTLRNWVNTGDVIGPMGDSGGATQSAFSVHVHLYNFRSLASDSPEEIREAENLMDLHISSPILPLLCQ